MTESRAHLIIRRAALARLIRSNRTKYGTCHGALGRAFCRAMKRQCGLS